MSRIAVLGSIYIQSRMKQPDKKVSDIQRAGLEGTLSLHGKGLRQAIALESLSPAKSRVKLFGARGASDNPSGLQTIIQKLGWPLVPHFLAPIQGTRIGRRTSITYQNGRCESFQEEVNANLEISFADVKEHLVDFKPHLLVLQNELPLSLTSEALKWAKENGIFTVLEPADEIDFTTLCLADLIVADGRLFAHLVNRFAINGDGGRCVGSNFNALKEPLLHVVLKESGIKRILLASRNFGVKYLQVLDEETTLFRNSIAPGTTVEVLAPNFPVEHTLCTDSFDVLVAGFIASIAPVRRCRKFDSNELIQQSLRFASIAAAISADNSACYESGACFPSWEDVSECME